MSIEQGQSQVGQFTDSQLGEICFAYMTSIYEMGVNSQEDILRAVNRIRGFVDAAQELQGMSEAEATAIKRSIASFALIHEARLPKGPQHPASYMTADIPVKAGDENA